MMLKIYHLEHDDEDDDDYDDDDDGDDDYVMLMKRETLDGSIWPTDPRQFSFQLEHFVEEQKYVDPKIVSFRLIMHTNLEISNLDRIVLEGVKFLENSSSK